MPNYEFQCLNKNCDKTYEFLCPLDDTNKHKGVKCPYCKSAKKKKLLSLGNFGFTTSKLDNFSYRAGHNMEKAKKIRERAEQQSHVGPDPYNAANEKF